MSVWTDRRERQAPRATPGAGFAHPALWKSCACVVESLWIGTGTEFFHRVWRTIAHHSRPQLRDSWIPSLVPRGHVAENVTPMLRRVATGPASRFLVLDASCARPLLTASNTASTIASTASRSRRPVSSGAPASSTPSGRPRRSCHSTAQHLNWQQVASPAGCRGSTGAPLESRDEPPRGVLASGPRGRPGRHHADDRDGAARSCLTTRTSRRCRARSGVDIREAQGQALRDRRHDLESPGRPPHGRRTRRVDAGARPLRARRGRAVLERGEQRVDPRAVPRPLEAHRRGVRQRCRPGRGRRHGRHRHPRGTRVLPAPHRARRPSRGCRRIDAEPQHPRI